MMTSVKMKTAGGNELGFILEGRERLPIRETCVPGAWLKCMRKNFAFCILKVRISKKEEWWLPGAGVRTEWRVVFQCAQNSSFGRRKDGKPTPRHVKTLSKPGIEGNLLNLLKAVYKTPVTNIMLNGERLEAFPLRSGIR